MQSQIRFNRVPGKVPEKVPEKVPGSLCAKPSQVQRVPEKVAEAKPVHLTRGNPAEVFPALGFAACSESFVKMKRCGCWGYRRSLFLNKVLGERQQVIFCNVMDERYMYLYIYIHVYMCICVSVHIHTCIYTCVNI